MKDINKTKLIIVVVAFTMFVNAIPFFLKESKGAVINSVVKSVYLVTSDSNPADTDSYSVVLSGDSYDQKASKYYIKIDWVKENAAAIKDGDTFSVDVSGLILKAKNTNKTYDLDIHDKVTGAVIETIGIIKVEDITTGSGASKVRTGKVTVTFNNKVEKYNKLGGSIYVRNSVDYNRMLENRDFNVEFSSDSTSHNSLALNHVDITPDHILELKDYLGNYVEILNEHLLPSDEVACRVRFMPADSYTLINITSKPVFNDYFIDLLAEYNYHGVKPDGQGGIEADYTIDPVLPIYHGKSIASYTFERIDSKPYLRPKPATATDADIELNNKAEWFLDFNFKHDEDDYLNTDKNDIRVTEEDEFIFQFVLNPKYVINYTQDKPLLYSAPVVGVYGLDYYDDVGSVTHEDEDPITPSSPKTSTVTTSSAPSPKTSTVTTSSAPSPKTSTDTSSSTSTVTSTSKTSSSTSTDTSSSTSAVTSTSKTSSSTSAVTSTSKTSSSTSTVTSKTTPTTTKTTTPWTPWTPWTPTSSSSTSTTATTYTEKTSTSPSWVITWGTRPSSISSSSSSSTNTQTIITTTPPSTITWASPSWDIPEPSYVDIPSEKLPGGITPPVIKTVPATTPPIDGKPNPVTADKPFLINFSLVTLAAGLLFIINRKFK